jgi:fructose transport system permease protein
VTALTKARDAPEAPPSALTKARSLAGGFFSYQAAGPLLALVVALVVFSLATENFASAGNASLMLQQSVVIGTLALGQTLVVLTAGIDLAAGAVMVAGSLVIARFVTEGTAALPALVVGLGVCMVLGLLTGSIVSRAKLPPFIVTLGLLTVINAGARIWTSSASYPVRDPALKLLGQRFDAGPLTLTIGVVVWFVLAAVLVYALNRTSWGTHVYAVGASPEAARLTGVKVGRVLLSVYVLAGVVYAVAAFQLLGRIPNADPSAYANANLDSITAVVIGGTSLFGGRGGITGTVIGAFIVVVLQNGLTQLGVDSLYQQVATGVLVIVAVAVDQFVRARKRA